MWKLIILTLSILVLSSSCSSIPKQLFNEVNHANRKELKNLGVEKKNYIKDKRKKLLNQIFSKEEYDFKKVDIIENFNLTHTPYNVIFAVKKDSKVLYYQADDNTNQRVDILELPEKDITTRVYFKIIFELTNKEKYDELKNLHKERRVSHPKFSNYYEVSNNPEHFLRNFIHFKDFGLFNKELINQSDQ